MKPRTLLYLIVSLAVTAGCAGLFSLTLDSSPASSAAPLPPRLPLTDNPNPPATPVKLIFIHHSTGGNWLADTSEHDQAGGLGMALRTNNYFVSATNYQWGSRTDPGDPNTAIGSRTDVPNWPEWFTGANRDTIMNAVYAENGQNIGDFGNWSRLATEPSGPNEIIMFKSCFPNSNLYGNPDDDPLPAPNDEYTVANFKAVYNTILTYFATRQDKLFIVITAPPLAQGETAPERAANARAFNNWLVNNWLSSNNYTYPNVAVFDYYNVLTSNGIITRTDDPSRNDEPNDYTMRPDGNHHYWNGSQIIHPQTVNNHYSAYPYYSGGPDWYDSHPTGQGQQKATAEFVQLLNVYYNRWKGSVTPTQPTLILTQPNGGERWPSGSPRLVQWTTTGVVANVNLYYTTDNFTTRHNIALNQANSGSYQWTTPAISSTTVRVRVESVISPTTVFDVSDANFTLYTPGVMNYFLYLPLILRNYASTPPACAVPLTDVTINGPATGVTNTAYTFNAVLAPTNATLPIAYTWMPAPQNGQGTASATYQWGTTGSKFIDVIASNCSGASAAIGGYSIIILGTPAGGLVQPADLVYQGAFRLPGGDDRPQTFAYGGNAMTFNPDHNTLFITGHDRLAYDELPDGNQIAEINIPTPVNSRNVEDLPVADFVQGFHNPTAGYFTNLEEIPKVGLLYLNRPTTGPLLHIAWGQHLQPENEPSHGWFNATLDNPQFKGVWFIGEQSLYSTNGYMFDIPSDWAAVHTQGRPLATGRMRDGGQGGMGPTLFAYRPWLDGGAAPATGTRLQETTLLLYENIYNTDNIERALNGYQHPDEWEGGAWLTTPAGKAAVLFAGVKGTGAKYWYGFIHPDGPQYPCVDTHATDFVTCRLADGTPCPAQDLTGCCEEGVDCISGRGWWGARFDAQFILYAPAQLAQVAAGTLESWQPQPYASIDIDEYLYLAPPEWDEVIVGWGVQRRYRIGDVAFDHVNGRLYVLELFADGGKPVVHVWQVQ